MKQSILNVVLGEQGNAQPDSATFTANKASALPTTATTAVTTAVNPPPSDRGELNDLSDDALAGVAGGTSIKTPSGLS